MTWFRLFRLDTLQLGNCRAGLITFASMLGMLVMADTTARMLLPSVDFDGWENPGIQQKVDGARRWASSQGRADVLLLSSSLGQQVDTGLWNEAAGGQVLAYNAAVNGMSPVIADKLFREVYYPRLKPSVLVYCVCPRDVNAMGQQGEVVVNQDRFWRSPRGRQMLASAPGERLLSAVEDLSYTFRVRRHVRAYLQKGTIQDETAPLVQEAGSAIPNIGRLEPRLEPVSGKLLEHYRRTSAYRKFSMPEDGPARGLLELGQFCREMGVKFVLVNFPQPPQGADLYDDYRRDYGLYMEGLGKIASKTGAAFLDAHADLKLPDEDFHDPSHVNRDGGARVAAYLYEQVLQKDFAGRAPDVRFSASSVSRLYQALESSNAGFFPVDFRKTAKRVQFESPVQVAATHAGGVLPLWENVPPGDYIVDLYGADERTTRTRGQQGHLLALETVPIGEGVPQSIRFELSRDEPERALVARIPLRLDSVGSIRVRLLELRGAACVLDSAFLSAPPCQATQKVPGMEAVRPVLAHNPARPGNLSFEHMALEGSPEPLEWYVFRHGPEDRLEFTSEARTGKRALRLQWKRRPGSWGCAMGYDLDSETLAAARGKSVEVTAWVRCTSNNIMISSDQDPRSDAKRETGITKESDGEWRLVRGRLPVGEKAVRFTVVLGATGEEPVLFDDVEVAVR